MEKVLIDTSIFIDLFRGDKHIAQQLSDINSVLHPIVHMELLQGARNKAELHKIDTFLGKCASLDCGAELWSDTLLLIRQFAKSHGLAIPDALIAAACRRYRVPLWTHNKKDFQFLPDVSLWEGF
ncbi:MAG: type II toxin-antitoxin system VapC family toxin [Candidatus Sericytochromatia bacterium]